MMERERILQQQHHQNRHSVLTGRDRSPLRNGANPMDPNEIRVKEEPRSKDDDVIMLTRPPQQPPTLGPNTMTDPR